MTLKLVWMLFCTMQPQMTDTFSHWRRCLEFLLQFPPYLLPPVFFCIVFSYCISFVFILIFIYSFFKIAFFVFCIVFFPFCLFCFHNLFCFFFLNLFFNLFFFKFYEVNSLQFSFFVNFSILSTYSFHR